MSENGTFWLPPASSTHAANVDALFYFIYAVAVVSFILLVGATFFFAWKYRKREGGPKLKQFTHGVWLEVTWSVIPALIMLVIFAWGFRGYMDMMVAPSDAVVIQVTAQKWQWQFDYPGGKSMFHELHIPAGRPVKLVMHSKDVLHAFYAPEFRIKADVIPGRYTTLWFQTENIGKERIDANMALIGDPKWDSMTQVERARLEDNPTVQVFCAEYCGDNHSMMYAQIVVHDPAEWDEWLTKAPEIDPNEPLDQVGKRAYTAKGCNACHSIDGSRVIGPTFKGAWGRSETLADGSTVTVDENYVRQSIREPLSQVVQGYPPAMPPYPEKTLSDREIDGVIAFLKTLN